MITGHCPEDGDGGQGAVRGQGPGSGRGQRRTGTALAHLAAQHLPPAGLPLGWLGPRRHSAGGAQRTPVDATQQLQRRLRGRAVARGGCGRLLECQQAAAERRAAGLHGALPAVIGALGAREGPVLLRPEAHHASPAEAVAAVGAHRLAGRALAQGAGGLGGARGERQGCGGYPWRGRRRRGPRARTGMGAQTESADAAPDRDEDADQHAQGGNGPDAARTVLAVVYATRGACQRSASLWPVGHPRCRTPKSYRDFRFPHKWLVGEREAKFYYLESIKKSFVSC